MSLFLRPFVSRCLELLVRATPKLNHVVVHGFPSTEGNVVEILAALRRRYRGRIYWLDGISSPGIQVEKKHSVRAMFAYITAEAVFFTHGLYGDPAPSSRQAIINLWHGDGIKAQHKAVARKRSIAPATYVVGGTKLLTERKAIDFKMRPGSTLVVGNPRIDQLRRPASAEVLQNLGLKNAIPFVVWMPTFRKARMVGSNPGWTDSDNTSEQLMQLSSQVSQVLGANNIQLVVKPHPLDAENRTVPDATVLDDKDLEEAGTSLYELLGASAGLITDYSSVWTDYLVLDRPIGFAVPDKDDYAKGRGLYPADALQWLPGIELTNRETIEAYVRDVLSAGDSSRDQRTFAARKLGLVETTSASDDLLDALISRGVFQRHAAISPREDAGNSNAFILGFSKYFALQY